MKFQEDHPKNVLLEVTNPSDNQYYQWFYFLIQYFLFPAFIFSTQKIFITLNEEI